MQQKLGQIFCQQEAGGSGNNIGKERQESCPKLNNMYIIYLPRIFGISAIQCKW